MDLGDLKAFALVVEHGSMKKAGDALGMSRTTLRRRLDALEQGLATPLLVHDELGVKPTRAGLAVLGRMKELIRSADDLFRIAQGVPASGRVRAIVPVASRTGARPTSCSSWRPCTRTWRSSSPRWRTRSITSTRRST